MRDWILGTISQPSVAAAILSIGWAGIIAEFLFPAKVIPGALGGVLVLLGLWALFPAHLDLALAIALPCVMVTVLLLIIALRARRNKRTV